MLYNSSIVMPETIRRIADVQDRDLAWNFFAFFSRMEYGLKRASYLKRQDGDAQADWDRFADSQLVWPPPHSTAELLAAISYFRANPLLKQVARAGKLEWSEAQDEGLDQSSLKWLLLMLRRVRNNLFHGGKFPMRPVGEPVRDRTLLSHSITILIAVVALDSRISERFIDEG